MSQDWRHLDLKALSIPEDIILKKDCVTVSEGFKRVENANVFYREALPPVDSCTYPISVLLLHGQMFSSQTWLNLETIHMLAAMGYRTIAVDLPGYANSPAVKISDRCTFLHSLLENLDMDKSVIVSPSMSGVYALPFLVKHGEKMAGYVPVAPVGIEILENLPACEDLSIKNKVYAPLQEFLHNPIPDLSFIKTPTMVVFGEKDRSRSSALLSLLPNSQIAEIPNGRHPAYLDNPNLWHQLLYNFLLKLC